MCRDKSLLDKMITHPLTKFEVTVGDANVYVGLHITWDLTHRRLYVDRQRYTETILTRFGYQDTNHVSTPNDPHVRLSYPPPNDFDTHTLVPSRV